MRVVFTNLNNNDVAHEIIFLNYTFYASGAERITVLFDGSEYIGNVFCDYKGNRSFKHYGKSYNFTISG